METKMMRVVLLFGSNWNNGVKAGISYLNSNNVATNSNHNIGRRLSLGQMMARSLSLNSFYILPELKAKHNTFLKVVLVIFMKILLFPRQLKN